MGLRLEVLGLGSIELCFGVTFKGLGFRVQGLLQCVEPRVLEQRLRNRRLDHGALHRHLEHLGVASLDRFARVCFLRVCRPRRYRHRNPPAEEHRQPRALGRPWNLWVLGFKEFWGLLGLLIFGVSG